MDILYYCCSPVHQCCMLCSSSLFPQGVICILPVLREGVLTGSPEQKEEAAKALGAVIKLTSPEALRPSVVNITGPLIRILGDRFAWSVKTALLETLTLLLAKVRYQYHGTPKWPNTVENTIISPHR